MMHGEQQYYNNMNGINEQNPLESDDEDMDSIDSYIVPTGTENTTSLSVMNWKGTIVLGGSASIIFILIAVAMILPQYSDDISNSWKVSNCCCDGVAPTDTKDSVTKSPNDDREYRLVKIPHSGILSLLVSDPNANSAAAAVSVGIGYFSDPNDIQGLAHFCEHMLFQGSEKYPDEDYYFNMLSGVGEANAYTSPDMTNFYFRTEHSLLMDTLDVFAQFFIAPTFNVSSIEREMHAVDNEYRKNLINNDWRIDQLVRSTSVVGSSYRKFGTGSLATLKCSSAMRQELRDFHQKGYFADNLRLVVLGRESVDELEKSVGEIFSGVPAGQGDQLNSERASEPPPFPPDHLGRLLYVAPVNHVNVVTMYFPLPSQLSSIRSNPVTFVSQMIGNERSGSLLASLKRHGWVDNLSAGLSEDLIQFAMFSIKITLSKHGMIHVNDVIAVVFHYIRYVEAFGITRAFWNYEHSLATLKWNFQAIGKKMDYVSSLAAALQSNTSPLDLLGDPSRTCFNESNIRDIFSHLRPDKSLIVVVNHTLNGLELNQTEQWYQTRYSDGVIPLDLMDRWNTSSTNPPPSTLLHISHFFVPEAFGLIPVHSQSQGMPVLIHNVTGLAVWYLSDVTWRKPKITAHFAIVTPVSITVRFAVVARIFCVMWADMLNEAIYEAGEAGYKVSLEVADYGLHLSIHGFSDKFDHFFSVIVNGLSWNLFVDSMFDQVKESYINSLENLNKSNAYNQAEYLGSRLLYEPSWSASERLLAVRSLTLEHVRNFIKIELKSASVEALIAGNVDSDKAICLAKSIQTAIYRNENSDYSSFGRLPETFVVDILSTLVAFKNHESSNKDNQFLTFIEEQTNPDDQNSAIIAYFQLGRPVDVKERVLMDLLVSIVKGPSFNTLRTKEQLGYILWTWQGKRVGVRSLRILVQTLFHPVYAASKILDFLSDFRHNVLTGFLNIPEEFSKVVENLRKDKSLYFHNMQELALDYWSEIENRRYWFTKRDDEIAALNSITHDELIELWDRLIDRLMFIMVTSASPIVPDGFVLPSILEKKNESNTDEGVVNDTGFTPLRVLSVDEFARTRVFFPCRSY